jgi:hypothetical protein
MKYIASTATTPIAFVKYADQPDPNMIAQEIHRVVIKGGANLADKNLFTPRGVVTAITDKDWEVLCQDRKFAEMVEAGFMTILSSESDKDAAVRDLTPKDRSAPKTESDYRELANNRGGQGINVGRTAETIAAPH